MAFRGTLMNMNKIIRMSERHVDPVFEPRIRSLMEGVEKQIKGCAGLLNIETLVDRADTNRYMVLTEWEDRDSLNKWLRSDLCKKTAADLDQLLDKPVGYREFVLHEDDVFLL